ncbi:GPW/gp25 family protein [Teredinibacter franksiae]|uniref:GPW/gp25 family protein n=1 Tax=Teredinibacter franksiae TaxID=2761453 RepID=UPI001625CFC8|nr:GPW/gp25 family protein [Teredinibacter franksiae]
MALLNRFIDPKAGAIPASLASRNDGGQLQNIIDNLQIILQSRRSIDPSQNFGLLDYSEHSLSEALMHQLCKDIQQQIEQHEKRLHDVQVSLVGNNASYWHLAVQAQLTNQKIHFTLELTKDTYQQSLRHSNGVFV